MKDLRNGFSYDRESTGWESRYVTNEYIHPDGSVSKLTAVPEVRVRPVEGRVRCGPYVFPDGESSWGDHRVAFPGTTCLETDCHVPHHPDLVPGWAEPQENWYDREGLKPLAAVFDGWDAAGMMRDQLGSTTAWIAAHIALDALRDAGYEITKKEEI